MWCEQVQATGKELRGWPTWLMLVWLVAMLSMPLTNWAWGEGIYFHVTASVLIQACLSVSLLARVLGVPRTALAVAIVAVLSWALEAVGSATGVPFGDYHYTDHLQPQIAHVPVLIPAAWMMMLPPASR